MPSKYSPTCSAFSSLWFILCRSISMLTTIKTLKNYPNLHSAQELMHSPNIPGNAHAWLIITLVLLVGYDVSMRYLFRSGSIGIQELEWHLFSIIFLIGAAYTLKHDEHVRLDILYRSKFID